MSHTTTIDEIVFSDVDALRQAVKDLNKMGVKCSLEQNTVPRAYSRGQMEKADYTLKLENSPYDVGFYKDTKKGGLVAKADFFNDYIKNQIGAKTRKGESVAQSNMGKLYATYAAAAATRQAIRQGYTVRRVQKDDGSIQLIMTGMKV